MINSNCSNFNPINYNILMVEDSKSLIKILNTSFKSLGFNTFLAMTLQEAREIIKINKIKKKERILKQFKIQIHIK